MKKLLVGLAGLLAAPILSPGAGPEADVIVMDMGVTRVVDSVLVVPAGTLRIPDGAFADRGDFHSILFEDPCSLREVGGYAFMGCGNLRVVSLPSSVRTIGDGAFRECSSLLKASIPMGVKSVPRQAFGWCGALREVDLPSSVTDLASSSFAHCSSLPAIEIPPGLEHVGSNAFSFCTSLAEVSLPASVVELESYAFAECDSLRRARLPGNSRLLGELIFTGCRNMEQVTILSDVPPAFDCNSTLFDPEEAWMYVRCTLVVPRSAEDAYRRAPGWSLFENVTSAEHTSR